ncbi:MAG: tail fiber domain-containing protein [Lentihominibacter sp.]
MQYEIDSNGYVTTVLWGCITGQCNEYTGEIPTGYNSLVDWADCEIINAWYVNSSGNLAKDSGREVELRLKQEQEAIDNSPVLYKDLYESQESIYNQYEEKEVTGNPITITDGIKYTPYIEIRNLTPANGRIDLFSQGNQMLSDDSKSLTVNGVKFTSVGGEITISGTATEAFEYTISGSADNTDPICGIRANENHYINVGNLICELRYYDGDSTSVIYNGSSGVINISEGKNVTHAVLKIPAGTVSATIKPMLNKGNTALTWEEYKSSHIGMNFELETEVMPLYPSDTLYPSNTLYPIDVGSNAYITVDGVKQTIIDSGSETAIGIGNIAILNNYDIIYTTQSVSIKVKYKSTDIVINAGQINVETKNTLNSALKIEIIEGLGGTYERRSKTEVGLNKFLIQNALTYFEGTVIDEIKKVDIDDEGITIADADYGGSGQGLTMKLSSWNGIELINASDYHVFDINGMGLSGGFPERGDSYEIGRNGLACKYILSQSTTTGSALGITTDGQILEKSTSSRRYKRDIQDLTDFDCESLYKLPIKQFKYKDDCICEEDERRGKDMPGIIAEELDEILPIAVQHNSKGQVENWDEKILVPMMIKLLQDQKKEIDILKDKVKRLEGGTE